MVEGARDGKLGIAEVPLQVRAPQRGRACERQRDRRACGDEDAAQGLPFQLPPARELEVDDLEPLGERPQAVHLRLRDGLPEQGRNGHVERIRQRDEHVGVGNGEPALPFRDRLPHHVQLYGQLFLREAPRFPDRADVLVQHGLLPPSSPSRLLPAARRCGKQRKAASEQRRTKSHRAPRIPLQSVYARIYCVYRLYTL